MPFQEQAHQWTVNPHLRDLNPVAAGYSMPAEPGHISAMNTKNCYLLHYVYTGCGEIHIRNSVYHVHAGQGFLLRPEDKGFHKADETDPWGLRWVIFTGELSTDFDALPVVFDMPPNPLPHTELTCQSPEEHGHLQASDLMYLYAKLIKAKQNKKNHVQKAVDYIQLFYMEKLTIQDIADHVGINRFYLSKVFKEKTGQTIQDHLTEVRLAESRRCLRQGYSVQETAFRCGFNDAATYSRLFKKKEGCSPRAWKTGPMEEIRDLLLVMTNSKE